MSGSNCSAACREDFFCLEEEGEGESEGSAICVPSCPSWSDYPKTTAMAIDVLVIVFACVGLISAVGVIVISGIRRKQV